MAVLLEQRVLRVNTTSRDYLVSVLIAELAHMRRKAVRLVHKDRPRGKSIDNVCSYVLRQFPL